MNKITQTTRYRQSLIHYAQKNGVAAAAIRYRTYRQYICASHKFCSFEDYQKQLAVWQRKYNDFPMRPLNWRSPKQVPFAFPNR